MRYFRRGTTKVSLLATAPADLDAPTLAEIAAGVDLSVDINDMSNWTAENSPLPVPDLADDFTGNIPGERTVGNPTLSLYEDSGVTTLWDALAPATSQKYVVIAPEGVATGKPCEVWPVRIASRNRDFDLGAAAGFTVMMAVPEPAHQDGTIAAGE